MRSLKHSQEAVVADRVVARMHNAAASISESVVHHAPHADNLACHRVRFSDVGLNWPVYDTIEGILGRE